MRRRWSDAMQEVRYFLFPKAREIDERLKALDVARTLFKGQKAQTDEIVRHANRPDILRNLVIAMTEDKGG